MNHFTQFPARRAWRSSPTFIILIPLLSSLRAHRPEIIEVTGDDILYSSRRSGITATARFDTKMYLAKVATDI